MPAFFVFTYSCSLNHKPFLKEDSYCYEELMGLEQIWNEFIASLPTLKDAWPTVIGLMILSGAVGFGFAVLLGAGSHDTKDQRIKLAEERVADYKDKLNGKSPDEAQAQIAKLREEINALATYGLSSESQERMKATLAGLSGAVKIVRHGDSSDADRLYRQTISIFRAAGLEVESNTILGIKNPPNSGVTLVFWEATKREFLAKVRVALQVAGLDPVELSNPDGWGNETRLTIVFSSRDPDWTPAARWG
ncbi:hypothetical protein NIM87_15765 [Devosia sp. XJ19-1]|uniref:Uncharacterized protein n=1 Tax=Devosia ureilytica TaxID=2952754 RepID=A0A9Q4AQY1_9HYPH|nr:hypothetical protein [Devosia ureilytica]MCP8884967.1 hypothetical protein [Devosia ureilytica]MCP8888522.1 hypothetical protein [Devosia ureilytica]